MDTIARPVKRGRPSNAFNLKDFTKKDANELGFKAKQLALKFLKTTKYSKSDAAKLGLQTNGSNNHKLSKYKSVDELKEFIRKRKAILGDDVIESLYKPKTKNIKLSKDDKKHKISKKKLLQELDKVPQIQVFHMVATIRTEINYKNNKKNYGSYYEESTISKIVKAKSKKEAEKIF